MYDSGGKLLNGIEKVYVNILSHVRVKWSESKCFRIDIRVRQDVSCPLPLNFSMYI